MKKYILWIGSALLILVLAACGSTSQEASEQPATNEQPAEGGATERTMPLAMQLVLGTFKLEETDDPVDAEQAESLLPLWKAARSLSESETAAAEEIQAVVEQIQETMTPEQMEAIQAMELTFRDMGTIAEDLGLDFAAGGGRFGDLSPEAQATIQAARESGQAPPGGFFGGPPGFPGGGGGPGGGPGGGGLSPEARQTAIAERGGFRRAGLGLPRPLLDAIIEFLEAKVQ